MDEGGIDRVMDRYGREPSSLIPILLDIQKELGWLSGEVLEKVSEKLEVPLNRVRQVATFYKAFELVPRGRHEIRVCSGTSCHARGAPRIISAIQDCIGIAPGETDPEMKFSLKAVNCLGCCSAGPVMVVDGEHHQATEPAEAEDVLRNCQ